MLGLPSASPPQISNSLQDSLNARLLRSMTAPESDRSRPVNGGGSASSGDVGSFLSALG